MKTILLMVSAFIVNVTAGQFIYKTVNNGIDESYKIAHSKDASQSTFLKLEQSEGGISLYIQGGYFCDKYMTVDCGILVNGQYIKYELSAISSTDKTTLFLITNLLSENNSDFLKDFVNGIEIVMRANESHCTDNYYKFSLKNSSGAINFMKQGLILQ